MLDMNGVETTRRICGLALEHQPHIVAFASRVMGHDQAR